MKLLPTMNAGAEWLAPSNAAVAAVPSTSRSTDASLSMKRLRNTSTAARKHATTAGATTALTVATQHQIMNVTSQKPTKSKLVQKMEKNKNHRHKRDRLVIDWC